MKTTFRQLLLLPLLLIGSAAWSANGGAKSGTGQHPNAYAHYLRALLLEAQGNFMSAREEIGRAIEVAPDVSYLYRTAAELSLRLGQVNRAAEEIEKASELNPKDVKSLILGGQINWAIGDGEKAEAKLKRAVQLAPDEAEAIVSLAGTLTPKEPKQAIDLYKNFLQRHPNDVDIWERLAQLYQGIGDNVAAEKAWTKTLEWAPTSVRAHLALAQLAEVAKDTTTAISHYEAVMVDDPTNLPLLLRVGELRYRNNEMAQAQEAFSRAQTLAPDSAAANFWMALLAENRGDWDEAIRLLEKVSQGEPDAGVYLRLSYYYSQTGRFKDAVRVLEKLVAFQPANTDFLNYLAVAYEQNKQDAKAEKTLRKVLEIDTTNHESHFQLATLYDRMKKFDKAEAELKRAIELKPDYHIALNYLGYSYADRDVKLDEAEALLNDAVGMEPENPAYLDSMGWLYYRLGKLEKASDFLREASRRGRDGLIFEHLGDVENAKGDAVNAVLDWDEAARLEPGQKRPKEKIAKALKKMAPAFKLNYFMKRAITRYSDVRGVTSLVKVSLCDSKPCFESKAQFGFVSNELLRVEIPGPLTGPVMLLTKEKGKPAQYGAVHPQFQAAAPFATRAYGRFESLLNADVFRKADLSALSANTKEKAGALVAEGAGLRFTFDSRVGDVRKIEWLAEDAGDSIALSGAMDPVPSKLLWRDAGGVTLEMELLKPVISTFSDAAASDEKAR